MSTVSQRPALPDGLVAFVKRACPTCQLVAPVLAQIAKAADAALTVYTQDDRDFPADVARADDTSLAASWHHQIETVPTLLRVANGVEQARIVGWVRAEWEAFTGVARLGPELPAWRPGCARIIDPSSTLPACSACAGPRSPDCGCATSTFSAGR